MVELMLVLAIVGILWVSLYPLLQGAISRSRDTGRVASLNLASAALDSYRSEHGNLPTSAMTGDGVGADSLSPNRSDTETGRMNCLSDKFGNTANNLATFFKGGLAPLDPEARRTVGVRDEGSTIVPRNNICWQHRSFGYFPVEKTELRELVTFGWQA